MKNIKRIMYYTMNSWNRSKSLAYNLKIYNVIDPNLQNKMYELLEVRDIYIPINQLIYEFNSLFDYEWQAGFNGRSGGYLVLYKGGRNPDGRIFCRCGLNISLEDVPTEVKKAFRRLAIDIVKTAEDLARNYSVEEKTVYIPEVRKVLKKGA